MPGRISNDFIARLQQRASIADIIGRHIDLRPAGRGNFKGLCPFHGEKTPSFSVSVDKNLFHCFGCGVGGNTLSFVMQYEHCDFLEAVERLAGYCGLQVEYEQGSGADRIRPQGPLYQLLQRATTYYQRQLRRHAERALAIDYLKHRGMRGETARLFGIGFAPEHWDGLLQSLGGQDPKQRQLLEEAGLIKGSSSSSERYYDRLRRRIVFPIRDMRGRVVGFGGRSLPDAAADEPKYLNSPETELFHKGTLLYGLYEALQPRPRPESLMLVEGYMDVVMCHQHGVGNAVATMGTAATREHLELAFRFVNSLFFCFDGDEAGRKAATRVLPSALGAMRDGRSIRFLFLPQGEDPDSLICARGADALRSMLKEQARPLSEFLFAHLKQDLALDTAEGRATLIAKAKPYLAELHSSNFRLQLLRQLAGEADMDEGELQRQLPAKAPYEPQPVADDPQPVAGKQREESRRSAPPQQPFRQTPQKSRIPSDLLQRLCALVLRYPVLATAIPEDCLLPDDNSWYPLLDQLRERLAEHPHNSSGRLLGSMVEDPLYGDCENLLSLVQPEDEQKCAEEFKDGIVRVHAKHRRQLENQELAAAKDDKEKLEVVKEEIRRRSQSGAVD